MNEEKLSNKLIMLFKNKVFISFVIFLLALIGLQIYINLNYISLLDSDFSSEFILGQLLAKENRLIFSHNWYYSTEIRVINNQIIYGLLFRITNNYRIVFSISNIIILSLYLLSFFVLLKSIKCEKWFFVLSTILLIPWPQSDYSRMILMQQFYIPHLCFSFLIIALFMFYSNEENKKKKLIFLILGCLLSFLNALEGVRSIGVLIVPLLLVSFIMLKKYKKNIFYTLFISFFAFIAFLINVLYLKKAFNMSADTNIHIIFSADRISNAFKTFASSLGFGVNIVGYIIFVLNIIFILSFIYLLIRNWKIISIVERFLILFICISLFIVFITLCFTNFTDSTRYLLLSNVFIITLLPLYIKLIYKEFHLNKNLYKVILVSSICFISVGFVNYAYNENKYKPNELYEISKCLINKGYYKGYATFWQSNVITQMTNGKIEMYSYSTYERNKGLNMYNWLQLKSHENFIIQGKTFIIFNNVEINNELYQDSLNIGGDLIKFSSNFHVITFNDITPLFKM